MGMANPKAIELILLKARERYTFKPVDDFLLVGG
jgi:hypothetical protein